MAINFLSFPTTALLETPFGQPIAIGRPPLQDRGPQVVKVEIPWAQYGANSTNQQVGVSGNLFQQGQQTSPLDFIRSVFIDNTFVSVPVYVQFPDSLQTLLCPPFGQVMHPCYTYQQQFTIYGDGFQDGDVSRTVLYFSNIDRQGYYVPAAEGGSPVTPIIFSRTQNVSVNTSGNYNFNGVSFGPEDTDRVIVLALASARSSGGSIVTNAVTIGGIAATRHAFAVGGGGISQITEIWSAVVPTGVSGNIVCTTTGSGTLYPRGSVYAIRNLQSPTPLAATQNSAGSTSTLGVSLTAQSNGVIIAAAETLNSSSVVLNWQGVQLNYVASQFTSGTVTFYGSSASALTSTNGNANVSVFGGSIAAVSFA